MKKYNRFLAVYAMSVLVGCASHETDIVSPRHPQDFLLMTNEQCENMKALCADVKAIHAMQVQCLNKPKKECRDAVLSRTRGWIDYFWYQFKSAYFGRLAATKTLSEGAALGLSAAGAISTQINAANLLSATAGAITGLGSSIEKNFAGDTASFLLLAQMDADRQRIGASIDQKMALSIDRYSLARGLADLAEYAGTMSVPSALASLAGKTGETKIQALDSQFPQRRKSGK